MGGFHSKEKLKAKLKDINTIKEDDLFNKTPNEMRMQYIQDTFICCGKSEPKYEEFTQIVYCQNCMKRQKIDFLNLNLKYNN